MPHVQIGGRFVHIASLPSYPHRIKGLSDAQLSREYAWVLEATTSRILGVTARAVFPHIVAELARRGMSR
jgi:hypothetical protein